MDPFSLLVAAAVGSYAASFWYKKSYDEIKVTSLENKSVDGVYTPAAVDAIKSQGQGQAGFIGVPDFQPQTNTVDAILQYVRSKTSSIEHSKTMLFKRNLDGHDDFHYAKIGDAVPSVVARQKTYGTSLPGTRIPGAIQGV
jgi:hypothetical protein